MFNSEHTRDTVGRTKLLKPVVQAMAERPVLAPLAVARFEANSDRLHSSTRIALGAVLG
ncbi:MAG: hypothetical protein KC912_25840 [Proteobacteria bacterium]|nr:hypothetical protein [Pseudomonadota bacterium]